VADHLAELLHHPQRVAQEVAVVGRELAQAHDRLHFVLTGLDRTQLRAQPNLHEIVQRARELATELGAKHAIRHQCVDALACRRDTDAALDRQRANAVHDRKCAGLLDVDQIGSDPDARHQRGQHASAGAGELVDVASEMREVGGLAAHHLDHRGLRPLHQSGLPGDRDHVEEDP